MLCMTPLGGLVSGIHMQNEQVLHCSISLYVFVAFPVAKRQCFHLIQLFPYVRDSYALLSPCLDIWVCPYEMSFTGKFGILLTAERDCN